MNGDCLVTVRTVSELIGFDEAFCPSSMVSIFTDYQHKRLYEPNRLLWSAVIGGVHLQLALDSFMAGNPIQQHQLVQLFVAKIEEVNVAAGHGKGGAGIAVLNSFGQWIFVYNIPERNLL